MSKIAYSKCGNICRQCPAFSSHTDEERKQASAGWARYFGFTLKPEAIKCLGCQASEPWKTGNLLPARGCAVRQCAGYNGIEDCAYSSIFPCAEYGKLVPGADLRRNMEEKTATSFSDQEYLENIEPFEGKTHLDLLHASLDPGQLIPPKTVNPASKPVPFPEKNLSSVFRELHSLLASASGCESGYYAGQLMLERGKPYILFALWVMGLYGELKDNKLVIESEACRDIEECSKLVRKKDNVLHTAVKTTLDSLSGAGIIFSFQPRKKEWTLSLEFAPDAGETELLKALKSYTGLLSEKYGRPVYAGSFYLKGKAFKLFSSLDMRDLAA